MEHSTRLAHISEDGTRTQTVYDHLAGTARLAGSFAVPFEAQSEAEFAAWLHDVGKYSDAFQLRLKGGPKVDHSTAGAQEALRRGHPQVSFAIAGHHSGLPDGGSPADDPGDATLYGRSKKPVAPYDGWQEVTLPASTPPAWACADPLSLAFFTRMLYSCLVDADFIDTETFMDGKAAPRGSGTDIAALRDIVSAQAQRYLRAESPSPVSVQRNAVLRACLEKGSHGPQGLYTLTVPTGGGKTFASLAFALEHAAAQKMKRVIAAHETAILQYMKDNSVEFRILEEPLLITGLGIAFAKNDSRGLDTQLNAVLAQMRTDGTLEQILGKYLEHASQYLEVDTIGT